MISKLLLISAKREPSNVLIFIACVFLYLLNEYCLKDCTTGGIQFFLICYFNDFLAPLLFLSYANILLLTRDMSWNKLSHIMLVCLINGILWEFVAPFFKNNAVMDLCDFIFYFLGGFLYWALNRHVSR